MKLALINSLTITIVFIFSIVTPGIGHSFKTPVENANGFGLLPSAMGEKDQALEGGEEKKGDQAFATDLRHASREIPKDTMRPPLVRASSTPVEPAY